MKNDIFVKIFCTLLICAVAALSLSVSSDEPEMITADGAGQRSELVTELSDFAETVPEVTSDPEQTQVESTDTEPVYDTVFVTDSGTKYHLSGCSYLRSSANELTLEEAEGQGYTPCSRCFK